MWTEIKTRRHYYNLFFYSLWFWEEFFVEIYWLVYIFQFRSFMDRQANMKPLPSKPPQLLPSDQDIQQGSGVQQPKASDQAPHANVTAPNPSGEVQGVAAAAPPLALPPPAANQGAEQMQPQVVIRYGDGREEVINVDDVAPIRRVAKAGQVIKPLQGTLSGSYPQANKPHQLSTSSLPVALQPGIPCDDERDDLPKNPADVVVDIPADLVVDVPPDAVVDVPTDVAGNVQGGDESQLQGGLAPSQDNQGAIPATSSGPNETKDNDPQSRQKYQSYSAPAVSETPEEVVDPGAMLSTPVFG